MICVPTYNEAENIKPFIDAVFDNAPEGVDVLVIDDNSPDGTASIVKEAQKKYPEKLYLLNRPEKQGLAAAYLAAFDWGLSKNYDVFLEMDADFSHNPIYISEMFREIQIYDVVIGSRNIHGGGVEGWSLLRNVVSKAGSLYGQILLGCPVNDLTGGFNMWTKAALLKINLNAIISRGYSFQIEMKYRAWRSGCLIKEIPIIFPDRKRGKSKMSKSIFAEALVNVWKIKWKTGGDAAAGQFLKFAVTGGLGTITNLALFFLFADIAKLPPIPVSIGCFLVSGTQNYYLHHRWSFAQETRGTKPSIIKWLLFLSSALFGLSVNIVVVNMMLQIMVLPYKVIAQACGIAAGMAINFTLSKLFVWRKQP